ncbi:MAG TPA: sigma-54 dependent transcriptional regulator [Pyrinomonadaceae bacterium]|nr:sigma-54 dependent transcriptional regulator [Pyrinomonadaceae bacterium]
MRPAKILLIDLNPAAGSSSALGAILESCFSRDSLELRREVVAGDGEAFDHGELLEVISSFRPDVVFLIPGESLLRQTRALLQAIRRDHLAVPVIVVTGANEMSEWLSRGATDFIPATLKADEVLPRVHQILGQASPDERRMQLLREKLGTKLVVGESPAFLKEIDKIPLLAKCQVSVLISGETGTGKEVCARAIHYLSARANKPFIPINCGAIPTELVENELFGHERGAYTNAKDSRVGLIQEADEGTLFLDEIDCLPLLSQVKLLRFLQEREYRPLGSTKTCKANVRIIAATNTDPAEAVKAGKLRQDLYYRLNVIPIVLPPLRERRRDILPLARHFLAKYSAEFDKEVTDFSPEAVRLIVSHEWPGNVRELEHVVVRAVVLSTQPVVGDVDIPLTPRPAAATLPESFQGAKNKIIAEFEKDYIERALLLSHGNISRAARAAQKSRRAFWELIRKHQIDVNDIKHHVS